MTALARVFMEKVYGDFKRAALWRPKHKKPNATFHHRKNKYMKLFSICTPQTTTLRDEWFLKTLQDDWELNIVQLNDAPQGNGDYLSPEWHYCINKKFQYVL